MSSGEYCRLCLKCDDWDSPLPIFLNSLSLPLKIHSLLGIELQRNDLLPQVICHMCLAKISFLNDFSNQVKSSTNLLNSLITSKNIDKSCVPEIKTKTNTESRSISSSLPVMSQPPIMSSVDEVISQVSEVPVDSHESDAIRKTMPKKSTSRIELKKCQKCKYATRSEVKYNAHISQNFNCSVCSASFCTERGMRLHRAVVHRKKHRGKNNGASNVEGTIDRRKSNVNDNCDKSNSVSNLWCKLCDEVFLFVKDFDRHNQELHSVEEHVGSENSIKIRNYSKRKLYNNETPDERNSMGSSESSDSVSLPKSNKKPRTNRDQVVKHEFKEHKNYSSSSETFKCWKCKGKYKNKEELFVHTCLVTPIKEPTSESDSENSVIEKSKRKSTRTSSTDSGSESISSFKVENDAGDPISKCNSIFDSAKNSMIVLEDSPSEDETDNPRWSTNDRCSMSPQTEARTDQGNKVTMCNMNCKTAAESLINEETVEVKAEKITGDSASQMKVCNECGGGFQSMKELFFHKQTHKISLE